MEKLSSREKLIFLSMILYVSSLAMPAAYIPFFETGRPDLMYGYDILIYGTITVWGNLLSGWLANPCYAIALIKVGSKSSKIFSIAAIIFAFLSFVGHMMIAPYIGYYVWVLSFTVLVFVNFYKGFYLN